MSALSDTWRDVDTTTPPSVNVDDFSLGVFVIKAVLIKLPLLVLLTFPVAFLQRVDETSPSSPALLFAILYVGGGGLSLIVILEFEKRCYWLLLCVIAAFVAVPPSPHHAIFLKLKLASGLLSLVVAVLCGFVYYDHRHYEAQAQPIDTIV